MSEEKNFTSSPVAKKLAEVFGNKQEAIKVPVRSNQDGKKFVAALNSAYRATQDSSLQFG